MSTQTAIWEALDSDIPLPQEAPQAARYLARIKTEPPVCTMMGCDNSSAGYFRMRGTVIVMQLCESCRARYSKHRDLIFIEAITPAGDD
jgi:hypothetical protein